MLQPLLSAKTQFWKIAKRVTQKLAAIAALVLLGGLLSATLVRMAPGFDADERELDPSLSAESQLALRQSRAGEHDILRFYASYLRGAIHGDLGTSHALGQPVQSLLRERWPVTLRVAGIGLLLAWILASTLAFTACLWRLPAFEIFGTTVSGAFLCIPAAVLALLSVILNAPGYLAIALIVFPKIYRYSRNLFAKAYAMPHITAARARGLSETRILACHDRSRGYYRQHRAWRGHSRRSSLRIAWYRSARLAGCTFSRPSFARKPYRDGYAGNLAGQLRGRCNGLHVGAR